MVDDEQQDVEITSNTNTNIVEEDELELSLSLRPLNNSSFSLPSIKLHPHSHNLLTKRDAQALRRHEAKLKRDLKRKTHHISLQNDALLFVNNQQQQQQQQQRCTKVPNLGFQVGPPWFGWNNNAAACFNAVLGFPSFQGHNCKLASEEGISNNGNGNGNGNGNDCGSFSSGSSSGISDNHHSLSGAGANSSDAGSHSSHPHSQLPPSSVPSNSSQLPTCSSQLDLQPNGSDPNHSKPQLCSAYSNKTGLVSSSCSKSPEGATTSSNTTCQQNGGSPTSDKDPNTTPRSIIPKEDKGEIGKPPRPNGLKGQQKPLSSEMPCVSTTGNGPNGKTVTGFLYKYTKTEVSIICVCHGSSFSPAEFVEHAGGVDVEYPLRHIRVVPFALG